jgi:hypothetical protein
MKYRYDLGYGDFVSQERFIDLRPIARLKFVNRARPWDTKILNHF